MKGNTLRQITIQGLTFDVDDKYAEGHIVTANEANALNQTRAENLRNNFAGKVKEAKDEVGEGNELSEETVTALKEDFAKVRDEYEFGVRGGGVRITDPVQKEARRLATDQVHAAIKAKHGKLDAVPKDNITALIDQLSAREDIQNLAKANIEAAKSLALDLDI